MSLGEASVYGVGVSGTSTYGVDAIWTVPAVGGRDEVGRLLVAEDADPNATEIGYDADGRCTRIDHSNFLSDLVSYDIVGKLMRKQVLNGRRPHRPADGSGHLYLPDRWGRALGAGKPSRRIRSVSALWVSKRRGTPMRWDRQAACGPMSMLEANRTWRRCLRMLPASWCSQSGLKGCQRESPGCSTSPGRAGADRGGRGPGCHPERVAPGQSRHQVVMAHHRVRRSYAFGARNRAPSVKNERHATTYFS